MTVQVRPIAPGDRAVWGTLFQAYGVFYETAFDETVQRRVWEWLMDDTHEVSALVATSGDKVIGFAHYRRLADTFTGKASWNLDDLYVSPDVRKSGAATALIRAVAAEAKSNGGGTLRWITARDNATARGVYDKVAALADWVTYELETD
jgi:GNAT superfamily N-acetyltransferase